MPARFTVYLPNQPARVWSLDEGETYLLGRDEACDLRIADDRVSRRHAVLEGAATWRLTDLESKNGVSVDGAPVSTAALRDRHWIGLGGLLARFEVLAVPGESEAERRLRAREASASFRREVSGAASVEAIIDRLLASVEEVSGTERAIVLLGRSDGELELAAQHGLSSSEVLEEEFRGSVGAVARALESGAPVVAHDASVDSFLGRRASVLAGGIRALVCLPLREGDRVLGVVYADSREPGKVITELDLEILTALADHAAVALSLVHSRKELVGLASRLRGAGAARSPVAAEDMPSSLTWTRLLAAHRGGEGA